MLGRDSDVVPSAKVRFVNPEQFAKASFPIEVTVLGMVMLVNPDWRKAELSMEAILLGMVKLFMLLHW